jgi:hypothetical protein
MKGVSRIVAVMALLLNRRFFPFPHYIDIMQIDEYIIPIQHRMTSMESEQKGHALARSR